jgi:hypothetical protein
MSVNDWLADIAFASVTITVKVCVVPVTLVPVMAPVEVFNVRPVGSVPAEILHV